VSCGAALGSRRATGLALALAAGWLLLAALLIGDYGPTCDLVVGEYPHGEQYLAYITSGDRTFLDFTETGRRAVARAPHLSFDSPWLPWAWAHPFGGILSAASCRVLWTGLGWVPPLVAHELPIVLLVALLLFAIVRYAARRWGAAAGVGTGLALLLSPPFFAHAFNNLKDVPEASLYTLAVLAFVSATRAQGASRTWPRFLLAGALTGFALAQKANAWFIPVQCVLWWGLLAAVSRARRVRAPPFPWRGALLALPAFAAAYVLASPMLWTDTVGHFREQFGFYFHMGFRGKFALQTGGLLQFLWSTPPMLLALAALGLLSRRLSADDRILLALGVAFPVGRTVLGPNFDGVRHFLEFQPFLALLAGVGAASVVDFVADRLAGRRAGERTPGAPAARRRAVVAVLVLAVLFAAPAWAVVDTHPNGVCYFNAFIGGLPGALAQTVDIQPSDFWANSYWQGLQWLDEHAEPGAWLDVPVMPQVAASSAPLRLRPDIRFGLPQGDGHAPLYVMYVLREGFFDDVARYLQERSQPVHVIRVQGAPILVIHKVTDVEAVPVLVELRRAQQELHPSMLNLALWARRQPMEVALKLERLIRRVRRSNFDATRAELRALLPARYHDDVDKVLLDAVKHAPPAAPPAENKKPASAPH